MMVVLLLILAILGTTPRMSAAQETDMRTFPVITHSTGPAVASVYVQLRDDLPGAADRSTRITVFQLTDSLYLRVIPQGDVLIERGASAYAFLLSHDADGKSVLHPTNQPAHGVTQDVPRAADFRNGDNTGPNELGPKNVNAAGEFREILFADYVLEIRILSFEIVGLGPSRHAAFSQLSCVATVRRRRD